MARATHGVAMTALDDLDPGGPDLTAEQAAPLFHVAPRTIRRWALEGEFPGAINIHNTKWLFPQRALIAYRESKSVR